MSLTSARRATLAALSNTVLPHGGALEPGASDVDVAGQLETYLDRCSPGTRRTVNLMLTAFNLSSVVSRHALPFRLISRSVNTWVSAGTLSRSTPDPSSGVAPTTSTVGRLNGGASEGCCAAAAADSRTVAKPSAGKTRLRSGIS